MTAFAFVFPGQGSQSVGMLAAWAGDAIVRDTVEEASQALQEDLGRLIHEGPKAQLDLTTQTQPVMLTVGVALYRTWIAQTGKVPAAVAGHSLGEYAALVASGVLTLAQAVPLVRLRAQAMQEAVPVGQGAMAAVLGLEADVVREHCAAVAARSGQCVEAVNFNDPKQTVIAGSRQGVEQACKVLSAAGARRVLPLPVSAPFHASLMKPAAERLKAALASMTLGAPQIPVLNNIDVAEVSTAQEIKDALYRQAFGPVRWVELIQALSLRGIGHVIECGPGKVLMGLTKRINPDLTAAAIYDPSSLNDVKGMLA